MNENKAHVSAKLLTVEELLYGGNSSSFNHKKLRIPDYQRPYVWSENNVFQLIDDIWENCCANKSEYRIGSIILHDDKSFFNIVDGQQRITTLLLILNALTSAPDDVVRNLRYIHDESKKHIYSNELSIRRWIAENLPHNQEIFINYLRKNCSFVVITVLDLSEAFQMFESQNGRGKDLEAYNLLKAYHIRAMEKEPDSIKIECDKRWEKSTNLQINTEKPIDLLKQLIDFQLYQSRQLLRNEEPNLFSKSKISEFKGFTIDETHPIQYPYQNIFLFQWLNERVLNNIYPISAVRAIPRYSDEFNKLFITSTAINQTIINGKPFFDYIETYINLYRKLFIEMSPTPTDSDVLKEFRRFYYFYCLDYGLDESKSKIDEAKLSNVGSYYPHGKACRTGDTYLRELYKSAILVLFDKFGEQGLKNYYEI